MLFGKKTIAAVFAAHYKAMLKITNASRIAHNAEFELLPAMFVIADYATASANKNRRVVADEVTHVMSSLYKGFSSSLLDKRCELYGEIIRGKNPRADWFHGDKTPLTGNAITKCVVLLGDILYNPQCADNYDTAPIIIYGIFESMEFANSVMKPLLDEMVGLFKDFYDL